MKKLLITLLIVCGLAAVLLPKVIGSQGTRIHDEYFNQQAQMLLPGVEVESETLQDGWFKSEGTHRIKLSQAIIRKYAPFIQDIKLSKEIDLIIDSTIHHGPFAFTALGTAGSSFSPVAAVSESTFKVAGPKGTVDLPGKLFTQVGATGNSGKAIYVIDEYKHQNEDASIDFDGLNIEFEVDNKGQLLDAYGKAGTLSIAGKNGGEMLVSGMNFTADMEKNKGLWFGESDMVFEKVKFSDSNNVNFSIEDLSFGGSNDDQGEIFNSDAEFTIGEVVVADMKFEDFTLEYSLENVDIDAMSNLQAAAQSKRLLAKADMYKEFKKIVERSPKLVINELSLKTPGGKIEADLNLGLPDEVDMSFFPISLLPQVQGNGTITLPDSVIPFLDKLKPGLGSQIEFLGQMGMLEKKGNQYIADIKIIDGDFTVNDNPIPLSSFF